nr:hypothetical protein [Mycobacterium lehmannii]
MILGRHGDRIPVAVDQLKRWILLEDSCFQAAHVRAWIDTELSAEPATQSCADAERIGLPTRPVQRQHELSVQLLPKRVLCSQILEFGDE